MKSRSAAILLSLVFTAACGGAPPAKAPVTPTEPPPSGTTATPSASVKGDPWQLPPRGAGAKPSATSGDMPLDGWKKAAKVKVEAAPAECAAYAKRAGVPGAKTLAEAVAESDPAKRDGMLVDVEAKATGADKALARTVRADLAPVECADAVADPYLSALKDKATGPHEPVLIGLSLSAKLARTGHAPPTLGPAKDKAKMKEFIQGPLKTWLVAQATAVEQLSLVGRDLAGYARGVVAIEAGTAELRLVENIRSSPMPKEWDAELKSVYEASLDEALEPRKARGRDAALVGVGELANAGTLWDARLFRAREILARSYGGRRIDALDDLMLPPNDVPPFVKGKATAKGVVENPSTYFRLTTRKERCTTVMTCLGLGQLYWTHDDFVEAAYVAKAASDKLALGVALALAQGPANAADMMHASSPSALALVHTEALDALAAEKGPEAGMAAFDAAYLRSLSPPDGPAAAAHWKDVAARFAKAAELLPDETSKKQALAHRADAETAGSVAKN